MSFVFWLCDYFVEHCSAVLIVIAAKHVDSASIRSVEADLTSVTHNKLVSTVVCHPFQVDLLCFIFCFFTFFDHSIGQSQLSHFYYSTISSLAAAIHFSCRKLMTSVIIGINTVFFSTFAMNFGYIKILCCQIYNWMLFYASHLSVSS